MGGSGELTWARTERHQTHHQHAPAGQPPSIDYYCSVSQPNPKAVRDAHLTAMLWRRGWRGPPGGEGTHLERALGPWGSSTCPLPPRRSSSSLWERPPRSCQPTALLWREINRQRTTLKCLQGSVDALRKALESEYSSEQFIASFRSCVLCVFSNLFFI